MQEVSQKPLLWDTISIVLKTQIMSYVPKKLQIVESQDGFKVVDADKPEVTYCQFHTNILTAIPESDAIHVVEDMVRLYNQN